MQRLHYLMKSEGKKFKENFRVSSFCPILWNLDGFQVLVRPKAGNHLSLTLRFLVTQALREGRPPSTSFSVPRE